jgi:hypothetical protein
VKCLGESAHVPSYRLHKPSGQARISIDGDNICLRPYGSPESQEKYARLLAEQAGSKHHGGTGRQGLTNGAAPPIAAMIEVQ